MAKGGLVFTKDNEYYTPKSVIDYFGSFDYDPATVPAKAKELGIPNYDTIETDGLAQDWTKYNRIWINPPFTRKHEFLAKAVKTYRLAKNEIYVLFPIEFLTTRRFHDICGGGAYMYLAVVLIFRVVLVKRANHLHLAAVYSSCKKNLRLSLLILTN
jgi:hypothetical protein